MIAICPAGPPNEMKPSFTQKRSASPKLTRLTETPASLALGLPATLASTTAFSPATILCPFRRFPSQVFVKSVEDHAGLPHELSVILEQFAQTPHGRVEPRRLQPVELVVFEVYVVDDLGEPLEGRVARQSELFDHRLERTVLTPVCELGVGHVEMDAALD